MMICKIILLLLMLLTSLTVSAEDYIDAVNRGNEALALGDYNKALESYKIAENDLPNSPELSYNMGAALLGQQNYDEAVEEFTHALNSLEPGIASAAHYNLGNVNFQKQDYQAAIESYTNSLNLDPEDMDAKYNLELARKLLKDNAQDEKQEGEEGDQKEESDKPEDDRPESDEPEAENDGDDKSKKDKDGDKSKQDEDGEKSKKTEDEQKVSDSTKAGQAAAEPKKMSKEDAERILNALKNDEKEVQKKIKRAKSKNTYIGKDW